MKYLFTSVLILITHFIAAQKPYYNETPEFLKTNSIWAFGKNAGLDFNNGSPVALLTEQYSLEGCASVADPVTGKLLFYSNGSHVWNANHQLMPNGDGLLGNGNNSSIGDDIEFWTTTQGVCIVPVIDSVGKYYIFSMSDWSGPSSSRLYYSVIDMNLNNGLGDVVHNKKNILLSSEELSEGMVAIPGDNCDIWLILHALDKPEFIAYHITKEGIDTSPVVSVAGQQFGTFHVVGHLAVSPDRKRIAIPVWNPLPFSGVDPGLLIGELDPGTAQVSNVIKIDNVVPYGLCFSPDNSKLYVSSFTGAMPGLYQYDLSIWDSAAIDNSITALSLVDYPQSLRLYNDTIYVTDHDNFSLSRINNPNLTGVACDYQTAAVLLSANTICYMGLGSDVVYLSGTDTILQKLLDTVYCIGIAEGIMTSLTPGFPAYSGYIWDDGSVNEIRHVKEAGVYWVKYKAGDGCQYRVDTFIIKQSDFIPPVINVDLRELSTTVSYSNYQWLLNGKPIPGASQSKYSVYKNGKYQVVVSNEHGCSDTSDVYEVTNVGDDTGIDEIESLAIQIRVYPNPAKEVLHIQSPVPVEVTLTDIAGKAILEVKDSNSIGIKDFAAGIYLLRIKDKKGMLVKIEKFIKE